MHFPCLPLYTVPVDTYMGCYNDGTSPRALPFAIGSTTGMTVEKCLEHCRSLGDARYAGLQFSHYCHCGNDYNMYGEAAETECRRPCSGNPQQYCGGSLKNSVYFVGKTIN